MKILEKLQSIKWSIEWKIDEIKEHFEVKKLKKIYPDYENDEYNYDAMKHIWGVKSYDDLSGNNCNFYTMNDIDITYHRDTKMYSFGIETAYMFKEKENECEYLERLLGMFTAYMDDNNLSKDFKILLFMSSPQIKTEAETIEELYANFSLFVEGFCGMYAYYTYENNKEEI